jgi:hypothetical protein
MKGSLATEGLTDQEIDIAANLTSEAFDNRKRGNCKLRFPKYRQMPSNEFYSAVCDAMRQQKFAHLRKPKSEVT